MFVFGRAYDDEAVLKVGYVIEKLRRVSQHVKPYMLSKIKVTDVAID